MRWVDVWVLYACELKGALRERMIVINSILIPIFLYPIILWLAFSGLTFIIGRTEGFSSRVAVQGLSEAHVGLERLLSEDESLLLDRSERDPEEEAARVREGLLDALVQVEAAAGEAARLDGNFRVRLTYDGSKERSQVAKGRLTSHLEEYRSRRMRQEAASRDLTETEWGQFQLERRNLATSKQMGAFLMGLMLPLFLVIMVALGSFYPAIDATAGERERGTWETLMTVAARRSSIVTAKFLYVATLGSVAGLLNVAAMVLSMKVIFAPLLGRLGGEGRGFEFQFPWAAIPVVVVGAVLLALFASAGMMILASFAQTFKEGQSMVTPFYLLLFLPVLLLQGPGVEFSPALAAIPVANLLMALREAIAGRFDPPLLAITLVVELVTIGLCLRLAAYILQFENVLVGSYGGSLLTFLRDRVSGRRPRGGGNER